MWNENLNINANIIGSVKYSMKYLTKFNVTLKFFFNFRKHS